MAVNFAKLLKVPRHSPRRMSAFEGKAAVMRTLSDVGVWPKAALAAVRSFFWQPRLAQAFEQGR